MIAHTGCPDSDAAVWRDDSDPDAGLVECAWVSVTAWRVTRWLLSGDTWHRDMSQGGQWTLTGHIPATSHHSTLSSYTAAPNPVDCRLLSLEWKEIPKCAYLICEQTLTCVHTYDQHTKFLNNNTIWTSRSALLTRIWTGVWWRAGCFLSARTQK